MDDVEPAAAGGAARPGSGAAGAAAAAAKAAAAGKAAAAAAAAAAAGGGKAAAPSRDKTAEASGETRAESSLREVDAPKAKRPKPGGREALLKKLGAKKR
jgi:hypothetical protein